MSISKLSKTWAAVALLASSCWAEEDPFAAGVRPTEPLTPQEQQRSFHLPPGFRIELFAAEPDIQKPMNMAFDSRGRMWLTDSVEYPYAAPADRPGRDTVKILEDTNGDGRADRISTFADGLNIPIGVYPFSKGALVYSIPNIWYLADTTGDGQADVRQVLLGPFDTSRDTHGMQNAFRRGFDGWVYACHGFANQSEVTAADGSSVRMHSGNTYRFDPQGQHIEQFTFGQVNPFGMTFDPSGQIFTADCHTKPIMLLIRGGYYDSFGKPHDGLGYVPGVMDHDHGSTAIAGSVVYTGELFPPEYRGNVFSGNVMTSRVNRDSLQYTGSTVRAREEPDFIRTDDPWFRPVDLQIGPDGALYIADFYNRIIGHYEVPLEHPGRDRHRGRIWRVTYDGAGAQQSPSPNLAALTIPQLIEQFAHPVLAVRMRATDEIVDRFGTMAADALQAELQQPRSTESHVQALWGLSRLHALTPESLITASNHSDALVRIHAMRVLSETSVWSPELTECVRRGLTDRDPLVRRCAVEALIAQPSANFVRPLIDLYHQTDRADVHLLHAIKIAVRNALQSEGALPTFVSHGVSNQDRQLISEVCLGLKNEDSAMFLLAAFDQEGFDRALISPYLTHIVKHLPVSAIDQIVSVAQSLGSDEVDLQLELLLAAQNGLGQRGATAAPIRDWAARLTVELLTNADPASLAWRSYEIDGTPSRTWNVENRRSTDGAVAPFLSSLTLGEAWKGTLESSSFEIPAELRFFVAGHLGPPDQPAQNLNAVRLRLIDSGEVIAETFAPRNDVAHEVRWDLSSYAGRLGKLEVVDRLDTPGYAWIAVSRFQPPCVTIPSIGPAALEKRLVAIAGLVDSFGLSEAAPALHRWVASSGPALRVRQAAAVALTALGKDSHAQALATIVDHPSLDEDVRNRICATLCDINQGHIAALLEEVMRGSPAAAQAKLAQGLARSREGADTLLTQIAAGKASGFLLENSSLVQQLRVAVGEEQQSRIDDLIAQLPSRDVAIQSLIESRQLSFRQADASPERGQQVFTKHCAACHQVGGQGAVIGPQLDGIGSRGVERIIEDILDPNRNIDQAFRMHTYVLDDGRIFNGLPRRIDGELQVIADQEGKEISFPTAAIETDEPAPLSLMPESLGTQIAEPEFQDLIAFLRAQRAASTQATEAE